MDRNAQVRGEFLAILEGCARGNRTMSDYMEWEIHHAMDDDYDDLDDALAGHMSAIAGWADELSYFHASEAEFREIAREELEKLRAEMSETGALLAAD